MNKTGLTIGRWILFPVIVVIVVLNVGWFFVGRGQASGSGTTTGVSTPTPGTLYVAPLPPSLSSPSVTQPSPTPNNASPANPKSNPGSAGNNSSSPPGSSVYAGNKVSPAFYFSDAAAGQKLSMPGTFEGEGSWYVILKNVEYPDITISPLPAEVSEKKDNLSFVLPTDIKDGRYRLTLRLATSGDRPPELVAPGELRVLKPSEAQVTIEAVQPVSPYPNPQHDNKYDFEVAGTNFARTLQNNRVEINGLPINVAYPPGMGNPSCSADYQRPCLRAAAGIETQKLIVEGYAPPGYSIPLLVSVRVGIDGNVAKAPMPLLFSSISKTRLQVYAVGAFLALIGILFLLVRAGIKLRRASDQSFNSLRAFLIDKDTNSYSLSKFQLTLFTLVTVFGYIYVFVCHLFVQWKFELPPVPEGLPSMMAVSVGTSVVAAGIGARIGGKGAGAESPSLSDFITSGGVVLPERFQFFLWTIVSSMGVLVLILASDPVTVTQLPKLPDGMLYLMGLSSAGYLGGKLVRGPGPSIRSVDVGKIDNAVVLAPGDQPAQPALRALEATITGDNLSASATFQLDDEKIPADQVSIVAKTDDVQNSQFLSMLKVQLREVADRYFDGPHVLRIMNPDGQGAEITYGTKITSTTRVGEGAPIKISVKGVNFKDPSTGSWQQQPGAQAQPIPDANIRKVSDTEIEVTLPDGANLPGELTIKSPGNLTSTAAVTA
ncbi:MAG TPA: hypothetical protein VGC60_17085 [Pyrinomonadaceae bacterium]